MDQPPVPGGGGVNIKVSGQQFFWRFQYPNGAVSFHDLVAPKDTTVTLDITSNDVVNPMVQVPLFASSGPPGICVMPRQLPFGPTEAKSGT